ncbi:MAG: hypothetical protein AUJ74_03690 [Candidatus Omnitrophica bacterium CG1_02_44_16]|nr:MAG: hypothetical protein AUJ74_03690 [Candidatus Omnitrophica bacterium CG1_02_44_16]PIY83302.1 MAG: hypothetical protein COY78_02555 [Candidatus Omnitrophica bacterium CG_4_10_14_0_8_um_filter_44_12]PIZ84529.1 MAG: hypothetical protein COX96_03355 [Candidatus Omnitrophica bacterium CG_4_10_14_0_2_um_filter_44_9]
MNKKQLSALALGIVTIILIVYFTPRYKVTQIDSKNFIITEQTSTLYKRSTGKESLHWEKILLYSGIPVLACCLAIFSLRGKNGKHNT